MRKVVDVMMVTERNMSVVMDARVMDQAILTA